MATSSLWRPAWLGSKRRQAISQSRSRQRRGSRPATVEQLESRALLAVSASVVGSELLINLSEANDAAALQIEGGNYAIRSGTQSLGSFSAAGINAIRVTGQTALANQSLFVKPAGVLAASLIVNSGIESTVVGSPIVTSGSVTIESASITLSGDVRSSGPQTYAGMVRVAADIVLDAGASAIRFGGEIRSTVGQRASLMEDIGAPYQVALSPDGRTLYASDAVSNFVYFIDLAAEELDTIDLGKSVGQVLLSPNGQRLYVANNFDNSISVIDTTTRGVVATINVIGTPEGMAISADGNTLYAANYSENSVAVINTATARLTSTIPVAGSPTAVAVATDGRLWVTSEALNRVSVLTVSPTTVVRQIDVGRGPADIVLSPDSSRAYVANNFDNSVSVIDTGSGAVVATVGVGAGPTKLAVAPDGRLVYVVNGFSDSVSVIDTATLTLATTVPVGSLPAGIALSADGRTAYVANLSSLTELGNDARSLTVRTAGFASFAALVSTIDPLRQLVVDARQLIESVGQVTLSYDSAGNLWANDTLIRPNGNPISYLDMLTSGWQAVAAERIGGVNTVVWRHASGNLHFWRLSESWGAYGSDGWQAFGSGEFYATEVAFDMDFNDDGVIGAALTTIESVGGVALAYDGAGSLFAGGVQITLSDNPVNYHVMNGLGWRAVAAETIDGLNTLVWRHASGNLHFWRFLSSWAQQGSDGWEAPGSGEFYATEVAFDMDFNSDGVIGAALTTIESVGGVTLAYDGAGSLFAGGVQITLSGNPVNYHVMNGLGWRAVAADVINGVNTLVWQHASGNLHFWRLSGSWAQQGSDGWEAPGSSDFNATEVAFEMDFNNDGVIGAALTTIESAGSVTLGYDRAGSLFAGATRITLGGNPVDYHAMNGLGWRAVAAEAVNDVNTLVWRHASGSLHFWRLSSSWAQQSSDGWQAPGSGEFYATEVGFGMDFNDDGVIGAALTTIESAGSVTLGYDRAGSLFAGATRITLGGNPVNYHVMNGLGWRAVAADVINDVNTLVWRHASGNLHFWRFSGTWAQQGSDGWQAPGSGEFYASERAFGTDFNDDSVIGGPLTVIENVGAVRLGYDDAGHLFANAAKVTLGGNPVDFHVMNDLGWRAVAAEAMGSVNTLVWRHASGNLHFWRLSGSWASVSSDGWLAPQTPETQAAELAFGMDLNGNGNLGT